MKCKLLASLELTSGVALPIILTDARGLHLPPYIALLILLPAPRIPLRKTSQTNNEHRRHDILSLPSSVRVRARHPARRRSHPSSSSATRCHAHSRHDDTPSLRPVDTDGPAVGITPRAALLPSGHHDVGKDVETYTCMLNLLPLLQPPEQEGSILRVQENHCPPCPPRPAALPDSVPSIGCASTRPGTGDGPFSTLYIDICNSVRIQAFIHSRRTKRADNSVLVSWSVTPWPLFLS